MVVYASAAALNGTVAMNGRDANVRNAVKPEMLLTVGADVFVKDAMLGEMKSMKLKDALVKCAEKRFIQLS